MLSAPINNSLCYSTLRYCLQHPISLFANVAARFPKSLIMSADPPGNFTTQKLAAEEIRLTIKVILIKLLTYPSHRRLWFPKTKLQPIINSISNSSRLWACCNVSRQAQENYFYHFHFGKKHCVHLNNLETKVEVISKTTY